MDLPLPLPLTLVLNLPSATNPVGTVSETEPGTVTVTAVEPVTANVPLRTAPAICP